MSIWIAQGQSALVNALIVFVVTFLPVVAWQYRRYGSPNLARLLGAFGLSSYTTALLTYTWLPLPDRDTLDCTRARRGQFRPFGMVDDLGRAFERSGFPEGLWSFTVLQIVFNVLLFVPWGLVVRQFLHRGLLTATLSALVASTVIEVAQLTGLYGIYPCAYRTFDVDDLLTNTLGGLVGALVAPLLLGWMPRARELSTQRTRPRPVTMVRRWLGMAADGFAFMVLSAVMSVVTLVGALVLGFDTTSGIVGLGWAGFVFTVVVPWIVCFVVPPWGGYAASGAQFAVWLTPMWRDSSGALTHGTLAQRLVRAHVVPGPMLLTLVLDEALKMGPAASVAWVLVVIAAVVAVPFTRTRRSLSGVFTRAEMVDIRAIEEADAERR
ncbi:VanZ family protein [Aestuariimicrobium ganziense]|uniref:VanZ family protein n=1 Tax=Aestuariimicrobium ganziense TaxID=2773677 RepID=UPI001941C25D|nr:VanZ family protein [Aestuariimicrobium ganziense]